MRLHSAANRISLSACRQRKHRISPAQSVQIFRANPLFSTKRIEYESFFMQNASMGVFVPIKAHSYFT